MAALLTLDRIAKRFGAVRAVDDVSLAFESGRIHAVVGENGAGKTTLLKVAAGVVVPDRGEVRVDGAAVFPHTVREATGRGIGMVQQQFALVGALTALENVILGNEPAGALGALDIAAGRALAERHARSMGGSLPWDVPVEQLGVGERQRVAIVRALARSARVLILDEPTAVLTPMDADALYAVLRRLADGDKAVIVVTHRLDEVRDHADVVSVLRQGKLVSTRAVVRGDAHALNEAMADVMGETPPAPVHRPVRPGGAVGIEVHDLRRGTALRGVTFAVREGEIVGVAGVEGNGQRELVRVLAGLDASSGGEVHTGAVAVVHEDRHSEGLVLGATVRDNLVLGELGRFTRWGVVDSAGLERAASERLDQGGVVPADLDAPVCALSGGNQQKVVVARAFARDAAVLVLAQPTRGVDLGAARAIHDKIARAAQDGRAVLLVSSDLAEMRGLCDRILVMARGRVAAELPPDASDADFGQAMLGASEPSARDDGEAPG
jgi:simple sugar transport system ATP-binding protein